MYNKNLTHTLLFIALLLFSSSSIAQSKISLQAYAFGIYPFENTNVSLYQNTLDKEGKIPFEPGLALSYEVFGESGKVSGKIMQGIQSDPAGQIAGFTHFGLRAYVLRAKKYILNFGIGPAVYYRQNWNTIAGYENENIYSVYNDWQVKFSILNLSLEYNYYINKYNDINISLQTIHPKAFTVMIGYSYWFASNSPRHWKPCDCPSFH